MIFLGSASIMILSIGHHLHKPETVIPVTERVLVFVGPPEPAPTESIPGEYAERKMVK